VIQPGLGLLVVRVSFVLAICLTFQIGIAPNFLVFGVQGDLMLLAAIAAGIAAGPDRGAVIGFFSGLLYDAMLTTPFGLSALTYAIVAFMVGSLQDSVLRAAWWIPVASATIASAIGVILYAVLGTVLGEELVGTSLLKIALVVAVLNTIAAPVVIRAMRWATDTEDTVRHRAVYR
jgi:rod shape-determining protein MreD